MRSGFGSEDPDVKDSVRRLRETLRRFVRRSGTLIVVVLVGLFLFAGMYKVGPGERGVIRTFGRESNQTVPGLHFRIPFLQQVDIVNVERIRRIEVGFRSDGEQKIIPAEALMITGDANIVEALLIIQYRVVDPTRYLFRLRDPDEALRATAEVSLRSVIGQTSIDDVITTGREKVQDETRQWLQKLMDNYQSGISVTEVKLQAVDAPDQVRDAFHEVVRAREEKEKLINQAMGYQADLIPRARGEARQVTRDAEAYQEQRVLRAKGDAAKFESVLTEYKKAERVTRERLYLETMERILEKLEHKVFVDGELGKSAIPVLPLNLPGTSEGGQKP